jgi:hypothetical protein
MGTKRVGMARVKSLLNENLNQLKIFKQQQISLVHSVTTNHTLTEAQSGAVLYWTHGGNHDITLPNATVGMHFTFVLVAGSAHANRIAAASGEGFFGKVLVTKSAADDKNSTQTIASGAAKDFISLHASTTSLGGNTGDVIECWCETAGLWTVEARLSSTGTPSSTAVLTD